MPTHRRLAAVLAADVVGYSRLIGSDEEQTIARLRSIRTQVVDPAIAANHGRLVRITGDGLLIEFASVIDALRCASEVQRQMTSYNDGLSQAERIEYRIGINVGEIAIGDDGDIVGDGVNIAARLEALADAGGICVSARVQEDVAGKLDLVFEDMGEHTLKNIARPVRLYRVLPGAPAAPGTTAPANDPSLLALPDKPSIAVLAFTNMSNETEQEFFADGLAEDIITDLSKSRSLFVIARNSSFTYKGKPAAIKDVGRELGVRYVLEGSVRKASNRVRVTAQLIEATTGGHVWAERYDRDLADIFAVQDEITTSVSAAIQPALERSERERSARKPADSLDAWESYHRGMWHFSKVEVAENETARSFFQHAIELDPAVRAGVRRAGSDIFERDHAVPPAASLGQSAAGARSFGACGCDRFDGCGGPRGAGAGALDVGAPRREPGQGEYRGQSRTQLRGSAWRAWRRPALGWLPARGDRTFADCDTAEPVRSVDTVVAALYGTRALREQGLRGNHHRCRPTSPVVSRVPSTLQHVDRRTGTARPCR